MHTISKRGYRTGSRSSAWSLISCFCDTSDSVTAKSSSVSRWGSPSWWRSRSRGTKRTVPAENATAVAATAVTHGRCRENARWRRFFVTPSKDNQHHHHHHQQQQQQEDPKDPVHATVDQTMHPVHHVASKCTTGNSEPLPLYRMLDPVHVRTQTTTSHRSSPERGGRRRVNRSYEKLGFCGELDATSSLSVLAVALAVMMFSDRLCAVFCMVAWFYLLPWFRSSELATVDSTTTSEQNIKATIVDIDTEEHKKMVVLKGFLQRDPRRSPQANSLSSKV